MSRFSQRSEEKELMDELDCGGEELKQTLKELKTINKLLGGNVVTTSGLDRILANYPQQSLTIADVGCGGGDMIRVMHDWGKKRKQDLRFIGIDANPHIIQLAKINLSDIEENVGFQVLNVFDPAFVDQKVDILTCTLFTHHFTDEQLVSLLVQFRKKARLGLVINDLHRHPLAYHSIKILTRLFSKSGMVKNDGPVSVLRSFKREELEWILKQSGCENIYIEWRWAFRWKVVCFF